MEAPGGAAVAEGPPRFQCPEEFCARRFAPGPALCPEILRGRAKQLLLIRAPASFSPESLTGHTVPLCSSRAVQASQPDGVHKVYSLQMSLEDPGSGARLLIPSGQPDRLLCAPPFSGSLNIWERHGDPSTAQPLFPVAGRPAPQVPEGLKQRFFPFGGWPKRPPPSSEALEKTPRKRSKKQKRQLQVAEGGGAPEQRLPLKHESWGQQGGPEQLPGGLMEPSRGLLAEQTGTGHKQRPLKGEAEGAAALSVRGASGWPLGQEEEGLLPGWAEDPERKGGRRRRRKSVGIEALLGPNPRGWQPGQEPWLQAETGPEKGGSDPAGESALAGRKPKQQQQQRKEAAEGPQDVAAIEEGPGDTPHPGSLPEESLGSAREEPGCKRRKKKKRKKEKGDKEPLQEPGAETRSPEPSSLVPDWEAPGAWPEAGPGEPPQPDGAAPNQRPKRRRRRRREEEEEQAQREAGLSAAGT